jgi:hypothetical protein
LKENNEERNMVKQGAYSDSNRLSAAKLHRHQRVQKMLATRSSSDSSSSSKSLPSSFSSSDSVSSLSDDHSMTSASASSAHFSVENAEVVPITKHQRRKLRNRQSAEASRLRKRQDADNFKQKVALLEHENYILRTLLLQKHPKLSLLFSQDPNALPLPALAHPTPAPVPLSTTVAATCSSNEFAIQS